MSLIWKFSRVVIFVVGVVKEHVNSRFSVEMAIYSCDSMVRGYHIYKDIWEAAVGEVLDCRREGSNRYDPFAVAIMKNNTIVGHIPRKISALCSLFLRRNGSISCQVNGTRRYSSDLPQGGLEIPCVLIFTGEASELSKVEKLMKKDTSVSVGKNESSEQSKEIVDIQSPGKKRRLDCHDAEWVRMDTMILKVAEKELVLQNQELNDLVINYSQKLLHNQFVSINGLHSTLLLPTISMGGWVEDYIQIYHCRGNHWITLTTKRCEVGEVKVYDSLYDVIDTATNDVVEKVFDSSRMIYTMTFVQKQEGFKDCGVFAIAFATSLAFGKNPEELQFDQEKLRSHLIYCLEQKCFEEFP